jgi:hypothetical protein
MKKLAPPDGAAAARSRGLVMGLENSSSFARL